jgi:ATP-dependent RNA helicase RhlE
VHRIGRTGRAGAFGEAISLVSESETRYLKDIEKLIGSPLEPVMVPGFEPGAADVPAYQARAPRPERHAERAPERSPSRPKPAASREALFDAPYVPSESPPEEGIPALVRPKSKKQVAALFRSPVKPDTAGQ